MSFSMETTRRTARARVLLTFLGVFGLSGCVAFPEGLTTARLSSDEVGVLEGSRVRNSRTPFDPVFACYGRALAASGRPRGIAVGNIRDFTGRQEPDAGFVITQGGALMAYSALGKLLPGIRLHERFDVQIAEAELGWINNRQLGDGRQHAVPDGGGGEEMVGWLPYFGGSVRQSDFFIVGGITEVNYNIHSGGGEIAVGNVGPRARTYTMNIAVDLRIVGTQSLIVYDTVTVEKQLVGFEVGFGVFRFFGNDLFDINIGNRIQEPLHFGVRVAIESGILQLLPAVTGVPIADCFNGDANTVARDLFYNDKSS